ncbi:MAG TPA: MFS transporter [Candidatus Methylacidiphilales bacterium]|nr:MFS transporter [Candidatus Methylacidiphilales bacterium]
MSTFKPLPAGSPASAVEPMPEGVHNVYLFEIFNTTAWSVVLGAPMLLFLQHLNATATILAIAASLSPVLNILQMPAARFVERVGYRRFVLSGWTSRTFFILGMTGVAFLPDHIDRTTRIVAMLFFSFGFNTLRGISVCGLLPWFTHIVPESRRGEFLARDQLAGAAASITCLFVVGMLLRLHLAGYSYGIIFLISALAGFASVLFLRRVPDVPVEKIVLNDNPIPWRDMFFHPPFFKYLRYNFVINMALGTSSVFWVRFFEAFLRVGDANILFVACLSTIVVAAGLFLVTPLIDRAGNKPVLTCSGLLYVCHFTGWALVAAGIIHLSKTVICVQSLTSGLAAALWNLANVRYVMGIIPAMGRPHFLALYSVVANLTVGLVPLAWGPVVDLLQNWHAAWGFWRWNCYSLLYCALTLTIIAGLGMLRTLEEPQTMTWDVFMRELLVKTPSRAITRVLGRLRILGAGSG